MQDFEKIAVFGGGAMGKSIALASANKGIEVSIVEINKKKVELTNKELEVMLDECISKWEITEAEKKATLTLINVTESLKSAENAEIIIEAITENIDEKEKLYRKLDQICKKEIIFASNTSTISISAIAAVTKRSDKIIGLHFLYPVTERPLVEIIRGQKTSNKTFKRANEFVKKLGKTAVEVFEYPGYITTRVILPYINEAINVLMEGVAKCEDIDTAMKLGYNLPVGPLELADRIGLDVLLSWTEYMFHQLSDSKFRPSPILRKMVHAGQLGIKTSKGFFSYAHGKRIKK